MCTSDAFPENLFTLNVRPAAMRTAAAAYRSYGTSASGWEQRIEGLDAPFWQGAEGDTYRSSRAAYRAMPSVAAQSFTGVANQIDDLATTLEYIGRRLDAIRPSARTAWERLRQAEAAFRARQAASPLAPIRDTELSMDLIDPQIAGLRRTYESLADEAQTLRRRVVEAATQTAAAIDRQPGPGPVPRRGADPYIPHVVYSETDRYALDGSAKYLFGGVEFRVETKQLSDGTWEAVLVADETLGAEFDPLGSDDDSKKSGENGGSEKDGAGTEGRTGSTSTASQREHPDDPMRDLGKDLAWEVAEKLGLPDEDDITPEASAKASASGTFGGEYVFTGGSREEAQASLEAAVPFLLLGMPLWGRHKPDAVAHTGRVTIDAGAEAGVGDTKVGGKLSGTVAARIQTSVTGARTTSLRFEGTAEAEHPIVNKKGIEQKTYGGTAGVTATLASSAGRHTLMTSRMVKKGGEDHYTEVVQQRQLTARETADFVQASRDVMAGDFSNDSAAARTVDLVTKTATADANSPEVRNGTVKYDEFAVRTETSDEDSTDLEVAGVGVEYSTDRVTERRVPVAP